MGRRRVDLQTAAGLLGISSDAVRKRAKRGTMPHETGADGKLYVWVDAGRTGAVPAGEHEVSRDELVEVLREQLQAERQAHAEARRLLMAALERIPAIEAPQEPQAEPEGSEPRPAPEGAQEGSEPRSWWRRWFGFD